MHSGLVSVLMPAHNAEKFIGQAIESVICQSYPHWELIIVNDGSTDQTGEIVNQCVDKRIRVIHQENGGESVARNTGLSNAQGEFVAFLDADDIYLPDHLQVAVGYLQSHPAFDGVYTDGYYCDEKGNRLQTLSSRRVGPFEGQIMDQVVRSSAVFGPPISVVLRRNNIEKYHLSFDPNIIIGPDWDFLTQYAEVAQFGYVTAKTVEYRLHQTSISFRVVMQKRALELAKCRTNVINRKAFERCSPETQEYVFYDLLVNSLADFPERESEVTHWAQFQALEPSQQARLLRLMASKEIIRDSDSKYILEWLGRSRQMNPADMRGLLLYFLYSSSPSLCKIVLQIKLARGQERDCISSLSSLEKIVTLDENRAVS